MIAAVGVNYWMGACIRCCGTGFAPVHRGAYLDPGRTPCHCPDGAIMGTYVRAGSRERRIALGVLALGVWFRRLATASVGGRSDGGPR